MVRFDTAEIVEKINLFDIKEGDVLYIHHSLMKFGIPKDTKQLPLLPELFYNALRAKIGESGTIIVPTFNFDFCGGKTFDRQNTPSKKMGVFSEYVRKLPNAKRSSNPMQSVAVVGKYADFITENDTQSAFSEGGAFDRMRELNTKVFLLGAEIEYISFEHLVEERLEVPYRYWKTFEGEYIDNGVSEQRSYQMFVRDMDINPILRHKPVEEEMVKRGMVQVEKLGGGNLTYLMLKDFEDVSMELMKSNPYVLVENHPDYGKHSI